MLEILHHIPGRLRVRMPGLKANAAGAAALQRELQKRAGVHSVSVNLLTGSVLIAYKSGGEERIAGVLGVWAWRTYRKTPAGAKVLQAAAFHALAMALERLLAASLAVLL